MGFATIVGVGADGRYTIQVDAGEDLRLSILAAVTVKIGQLEVRLSAAQTKVDEADAAEAFLVTEYNDAADAYITQFNSPGQPPNSNALVAARTLISYTRLRNYPLRIQLDAVKFELSQARKLAASMNTVQTQITKPAWCVDYTTDGEVGDGVATIDIPGDTNLQLIAPGCRGWMAADGQFMARELCSPEQAYFAAAIFPGWQKFLPTYRWGTLTAVDRDADTGSVALFDQKSTAQGLSVNQASVLSDVPIEYMTCHAQAFEVDDRVVVQFVGQDWSNPRVIGFVDNPRTCDLECFHLAVSEYAFQVRAVTLMDALFGGSATYEVKLNGGAWELMIPTPGVTQTSSSMQFEWRFDDNMGGINEGVVWITLFRYGIPLPGFLGGFPPGFAVLVSPSGPYPPARAAEDVNIFEVRIKIAGTMVFNAAMRDMGFAGEGITTGYVRNRNGIRLQSFTNSTGTNVQPLDYTLTGDTS